MKRIEDPLDKVNYGVFETKFFVGEGSCSNLYENKEDQLSWSGLGYGDVS